MNSNDTTYKTNVLEAPEFREFGSVDEVLILNRSLSAEEIFQLYKGGYMRRVGAENLSLALRFEEGQGNVTYDWSGSAWHGTLIGAEWATGKYGRALAFNGTGSWVNVSRYGE